MVANAVDVLDGYDIDSWEKGELLTVNDKLPFGKSDQVCNAVKNSILGTSVHDN